MKYKNTVAIRTPVVLPDAQEYVLLPVDFGKKAMRACRLPVEVQARGDP